MRILVELDALMDTRLSVVASIDSEAAVRLVLSPDYYLRENDVFTSISGIPHEQYQKAFSDRNDDHVKGAMVTNILLMLREMTYHLRELARSEPLDHSLRVDVNVYPYHLDDFRDEIASAITAHCCPETLVTTVRVATEDITPSFLKRDYNAFIVYNFNEWFSKHAVTFEKVSIPKVTVFTPALYLDKAPELDQDDMANLKEHDPFALLEDVMVFSMRLQFMDAKDFSILQYWELPEKEENA